LSVNAVVKLHNILETFKMSAGKEKILLKTLKNILKK